MKKFILLALFVTSSAFAAEVTVLDETTTQVDIFYTYVDASFKMDQTTREGFAVVNVIEERPDGLPGYYDQYGRWYPSRFGLPRTVWTKKVKIDGLTMVDDQVIYQGAQGEVVCGKMTVSRILKKPVLKLNGNCKLSGKITADTRASRIVVKLKTK